MLTLERHLESCSISNDYELLKSIWVLNKKFLPNAQSAIIFNFPHYSLHESSHSNTIIKNIESFLGQERIAQLSPTDTWLILMAAHTHDLGMVVFNNVLENKWQEEEFQNYLKDISDNSNDTDLKKAAKLLVELNNKSNFDFKKGITLALEIRKSVILITADFFRRTHHARSKDILLGNDKEFNKYIDGFSLTGIPNRFTVVLAEIAYAHGIDFYSVFDRLEFEGDGFGGDKMHPRFVANLLRLGDLLDVDDKRFNIFSEKAFSNQLPRTSELHQEKHASVKHLLISPTAIEATVDCMSDEVYRVTREWFDWLQKEVEDQSREWAYIAPKSLSGLPPTISRRGGIKILYKSSEAKKDLMNLRFEISNKKVFEMFEGSAIYEYAGLVFIREIVQNALDASKIQLWKLVENGYYDNIIRRKLNVSWDVPHEELIKKVEFFFDMPNEIWENFQINLNLFWNDDTLTFSIQDNGTGISEGDLIRMTKKVGESRSQDPTYQNLKKNIPFWLKPTGAFGIGLQSLFMVANSFVIQTKSEYEEAREIQFYSAKNGEYCRITPTTVKMRRGTKLDIKLKAKDFDNIFENTFPTQVIYGYDWFDDEYKNIYIHKVIAYILNEFRHVELLNISINNKLLKKSLYAHKNYLEYIERGIEERRENIVVYMFKETQKKDYTLFRFFENLGIGSDCNLYFPDTFFTYNQNRRVSHGTDNTFLVRDIPVEEKSSSHYYKTSYFTYTWNFESPESDKILNIARSRFIRKTKNKFNGIFLNEVLPKAMELVVRLAEDNFDSGFEKNAILFFHIHLTALMSKCKVSQSERIYENFHLPESFVLKPDLSSVMFKEFFIANRFLSISVSHHVSVSDVPAYNREQYSLLYEEQKFSVDLVLWDFEYFEPFIKVMGYVKREHYLYTNSDRSITIFIYEKIDPYNSLIYNVGAKNQILRLREREHASFKRRSYLPPLEEYWEKLAVTELFDEFYFREASIDCHIISPFRNFIELKTIINNIIEKRKSNNNFDEKEFVKSQYLLMQIPEALLEFVIHKTPFPDKKRSREEVLDMYLTLIMEIVKINEPTINNIEFQD